MSTYIDDIQAFITDCYNDIGALPDEVIDDAIDEFWDIIPEDVYDITLTHPGIDGALIIVEIDNEGEIAINRVYANPEDQERDEFHYATAELEDPEEDCGEEEE